MKITLNQLHIMLQVSRTGSISRTAEEMNLTQPAVSIQLKNLQSQFEIPVTEMINRRIYLTDFGKELVDTAEKILDQIQDLERKGAAVNGKMTGRLRISVVSTGKYVIPYFLSSFLGIHDEVELELVVSNKSSVMDDLSKNKVDFSLVSVLPSQLHLRRIELMPNYLFLIGMQPSTAKQKAMEAKEIERLPLIYREQGSATRFAMERFIEKKRIRVRKKLELTSNEAVKQAIMAGLGFSIMPVIGLRNEIMNGQLSIIPVQGLPIKTAWNLVWPAEKKHSPVANAWKEHLRKEKQNIIDRHFGWCRSYWLD